MKKKNYRKHQSSFDSILPVNQKLSLSNQNTLANKKKLRANSTGLSLLNHRQHKQASLIQEKYLPQLQEMFGVFDLDGNNQISIQQLMIVLNSLGHKLTQNDVKLILSELDANQNDMIDIRQFSAVMIKKIEQTNLNQQEKINVAFSVFDIQGNRRIKPIDIQKIMITMGMNISESQAKLMVSEIDEMNKGYITFEEFDEYMKRINCFRDQQDAENFLDHYLLSSGPNNQERQNDDGEEEDDDKNQSFFDDQDDDKEEEDDDDQNDDYNQDDYNDDDDDDDDDNDQQNLGNGRNLKSKQDKSYKNNQKGKTLSNDKNQSFSKKQQPNNKK